MLLLLASVFLTAQGASVDLRTLSVVRFDFDNDVLLGKDNSFTAGWSIQWHSRLNDVWGPGSAKWIGRVPGLGASVSWSAYDNRRLAALQVYAGCMGPCSAAEPVQKFVHGDLGFGPFPRGWDNQLVNKALFNVNYEYRYKLFLDRPARYFTPG